MSWNAASIILFLCSPSRSPRSVWVEILQVVLYSDIEVVTLPTERVSWNLYGSQTLPHFFLSRSPRSVWVEIFFVRKKHPERCVTLPTERVSWNTKQVAEYHQLIVTLLTERVSWNGYGDETEIVDKSHAPHGACELKCMPCGPLIVPLYVTLPTERVSWNVDVFIYYSLLDGHAPHGACELKFMKSPNIIRFQRGHAPHGACELKWPERLTVSQWAGSRSPRSVWVEMVT